MENNKFLLGVEKCNYCGRIFPVILSPNQDASIGKCSANCPVKDTTAIGRVEEYTLRDLENAGYSL